MESLAEDLSKDDLSKDDLITELLAAIVQ